MELTGKCKEDFDKWLDSKNPCDESCISSKKGEILLSVYLDYMFYQLPFSMKIGVYQLFFDSVGISIDQIKILDNYFNPVYNSSVSRVEIEIDILDEKIKGFKSTEEAWTEAIKQANDLYNENNP